MNSYNDNDSIRLFQYILSRTNWSRNRTPPFWKATPPSLWFNPCTTLSLEGSLVFSHVRSPLYSKKKAAVNFVPLSQHGHSAVHQSASLLAEIWIDSRSSFDVVWTTGLINCNAAVIRNEDLKKKKNYSQEWKLYVQ